MMYETAKVLVIGGADPPTATAETIDLTGGGVYAEIYRQHAFPASPA